MEYCPDAVPLYLHRMGNEVENVAGSGSVITIPAGSYLAIPMSAPFYGTLPGGILPPSAGDGYWGNKGGAFAENKTGAGRKVFVVDSGLVSYQDSYPLKIESVWSLAESSQNNSKEYASATGSHTNELGLSHSTDALETSKDVAYTSEKKSQKLDTGDESQTVEASSKLDVTCNTSTLTSNSAEANALQEAQTQTSLPSSAFQPATCTQNLSFMCCWHEFSSEELFFAHLKEVHSEGFVAGSGFEGNLSQSFTCETCGQVFSEERLYSLHGQIVKISNSQLKDLLDIIFEGSSEDTKAPYADKQSTGKKIQPPKGSFDCYYCTSKSRTYYLYGAFSRHLENIHKVPPLNEQGNPQCQVCVEEFPDLSALYEHIEHYHVRKATNVFNECVKNVRSRAESGQELKCVFCQRLFTKERLYFVHLKGHFVKKDITSSRKRRWKLADLEVENQPENLPTEMDICKADEDVKTEEDSTIEVKVDSEQEEVSSQNKEKRKKKKKKKSKGMEKLLEWKRKDSVSEAKTESVPAEEELKERKSKKFRKKKRKHTAENEESRYTGRYSFVKSLIKASNEKDTDKIKTTDEVKTTDKIKTTDNIKTTDKLKTTGKVIKSKSGRVIKKKYPGSEVTSAESKSSDVSTKANLEKDDGKIFAEKPRLGRPRKNASQQQVATDETETLAVNAETVLDSTDMHTPGETQAQTKKRSKNEKELGYHCCSKSFKDETLFFSHLQNSHQQFQNTSENVSDSCPVCGQCFPSLGQLLFHTNLHEALKVVGLPDKFQQPTGPILQSVTKSEVQTPESNKPVGYFICQMCRSSSKDPSRAQSGQRRTYNTFWAFSFHMQKAHNVPFLNEEGKPRCQYCSESFDSEGECYRHISTSHPKFIRAPTSTFSQQVEDCLGQDGDNRCVLCGREFLKRRVCQIHLKKHFSWE
ncbi:Hypp2519 [Branchiostoma lanceolatum]|uniref:Hypp2519 protein n=1 Tax=Branchiostoma lanceolatum TaxID=7740 RepID=A0A8J9ZVW5_BRALA|nr:Hypp2519 [Branchiostoma lanceolatum]